MSKKKTSGPARVLVTCRTCHGSGVRPGRSVAELAKLRTPTIAACYVAEIHCFDCKGTGKEKRLATEFDSRTAAELEPAK